MNSILCLESNEFRHIFFCFFFLFTILTSPIIFFSNDTKVNDLVTLILPFILKKSLFELCCHQWHSLSQTHLVKQLLKYNLNFRHLTSEITFSLTGMEWRYIRSGQIIMITTARRATQKAKVRIIMPVVSWLIIDELCVTEGCRILALFCQCTCVRFGWLYWGFTLL